ncbi:hypothetical protein [Paraburkholderia tropica]|uniref:hypothetical protein n=1 Tax=Paraburkholderia tropica TaxID=92647 RepID=UPI00160F9FB1|nr:hypothetical protein [Paraburkholderia tropica]MBB6319246.1 hypothetical protein [Paraburkholderia tropica]
MRFVMPYVLTSRPTFTWPVTVIEPGNAPDGAVEESQFVVEFARKDGDELEALFKDNKPVRVALKDLVVGWTGLRDEGGSELPFDQVYLDALLKVPHAVVGLWTAFLEGAGGATRKN